MSADGAARLRHWLSSQERGRPTDGGGDAAEVNRTALGQHDGISLRETGADVIDPGT
jgi:hypothetical protein